MKNLRIRRNDGGYTLVELLVATVIFITLAAIAVPLILQQRATVDMGELKADLINASYNVEESKVDNGGKYPLNLPEGIDEKLVDEEATLNYTYPYDRLDYCLQIISGDTTLFKSSESAEVSTTDCTYDFVIPSTKLTGKMKGFSPVLSWNTVVNATKYTIYKNNIPVKTVSVSSGSADKTASYTLPDMNPTENATFHIVVGNGGGGESEQSNTVRLKAPIPTPTKPEIKLVSKNVKDSRTMSFTIGWRAVKYAKGYEVYDVTGSTPTRIETLGESAGSYKYESPRGEVRNLLVKAKNDSGLSGDSNTLELSSEWDTPEIVSAKSDAKTGKINFVFHKDKNGTITPDYGWPTSSVRLVIFETASGEKVFDQSGIKAMDFSPNKSFKRVNHRATITPTTSTGEVLSESDAVEVTFPPPTKPSAPKSFSSDNGGDADISPNRLTWAEVSCSESSTAEYRVTHNNKSSDWFGGKTYNIPAGELTEGKEETFSIEARCTNANGTSSASGKSETTFTTGLSTPEIPTGLNVPNRGDTAKWDAVTCAAGSSAEYSLKQTTKNNDNADVKVSPLKTNSYKFPSMISGATQNFAVQARCVKYNGAGAVDGKSSWTAFSGFYDWSTPYEAPSKPVLKEVSKSYPDSKTVQFKINWGADKWGHTNKLYDASDDSLIGTFTDSVIEAKVNGTRGESLNVYMIASNKDETSKRSETIKLADKWDSPAIISTKTDPYTGFINVKWQDENDSGERTPDWGTPDSRFKVFITDTKTDETKVYSGLTETEMKGEDEFPRNDQEIYIEVETSTGVILKSPVKTVSFPPPGPPSAVTGIRSSDQGSADSTPNRLYWNEVSCGPGDAEYMITDLNSGDSGWIKGKESGNERYYDINNDWLREGFKEDFSITARCLSPAGVSVASEPSAHSFTVDISTPDAVEEVSNNKKDTVSWAHSETPNGLDREYRVSTTTFNGEVSDKTFTTTNSRQTISSLKPDSKQVVTVQVRFYNAANGRSSSWSPAVSSTWITPKPVPGTPAIKLDSSNVLNSKTQRYKISWATTSWAEEYNIVNVQTGDVIKTTTGTTANVDLERGIASTSIAVEAVNRSATSPKSNSVKLYAPWQDPEVISAEGNRDGTMSIKWQTGTTEKPTPDWGSPDSTVDVEVRESRSNGTVVYSKEGIKTTNHTTTGFANDSRLRGKTYFVTITVHTSTGKTLESSYVTAKYERPLAPARVKNLSSDNKGPGTVKNDRLTWDTVTCSQENSRAEYWVGTVPLGENYRDGNSTGISGWQAGISSYTIPQKFIEDIQGQNIAFIVMSNCRFIDNNDYKYDDVIVDGDGYHEFTVGVAEPTTNPGKPTRANQFTDTVDWSKAVCGKGTTPEYQIERTITNGKNSSYHASMTDNTFNPSSIEVGENQGVKVQARCVLNTDASKRSGWGPYSSALEWRSPFPKPSAPAITSSSLTYTSATDAQQVVSWSGVAHAETYIVYDGTKEIATIPANKTSYTVPLERGSAAAKKIKVKAANFTYPKDKTSFSNTLSLNAPWSDAEILSTDYNQSRQLSIVWQKGSGSSRNPNWGNDSSKVDLYVKDTSGKVVYSKKGITGNSQQTTEISGTEANFSTYIVVTTANGEKLTSPSVKVTLNPPEKPAKPTNLKVVNGSGPINPSKLTWSTVTCPTSGSTAEYQITHNDPEFSNKKSDWVTGGSFNIPQSWLEAGREQQFSIVARCTSTNGESDPTEAVSVTSSRTNVPAPDAPKNFTLDSKAPTSANVSWDAVTCPNHLRVQYLVSHDVKNGDSYPKYNEGGNYKTTSDTSVSLTGLEPGTPQKVYVIARCYDPANSSGITSTWASAPKSDTISWDSPIPAPTKPALKVSGIKTNPSDEALTTGTLSWAAIPYATKYHVYETGGKLVGTQSGTSRDVNSTRGTSTGFYVVAENASGVKSPASNTVTVSSTWPKIKISETAFNSKSGAWVGQWATARQDPDWGKSAKFQFVVKNASNQVVENTQNLSYTTLSRSISLPDTPSNYSMYVVVTTASGEKIASNIIHRDWVKPPSTPTGFKHNDYNTVSWNSVKCESGSTPYYWIEWSDKNGTGQRGSLATTNTYYNVSMTPNTKQTMSIKARCDTNSYGNSEYSSYSSDITFNAYYKIPNAPSTPASSSMDGKGSNKKTDMNRVTWSAVSCPTGSTVSYQVRWIYKNGVEKKPNGFFQKSGITGTSYNLTSDQQQAGSSNSWSVAATCTVELGDSEESGQSYTGWHDSSISKPTGSVNSSHNGYGTVEWNDNMKCTDAGVTKKFRWALKWENGVNTKNRYTDWAWDADSKRAMFTDWDAEYGLRQINYIQVACIFDDNGTKPDGESPEDHKNGGKMDWTPKVSSPNYSNVWSSKRSKKTTWDITCPRGTNYRYQWTTSKYKWDDYTIISAPIQLKPTKDSSSTGKASGSQSWGNTDKNNYYNMTHWCQSSDKRIDSTYVHTKWKIGR